MLPSQMQAWSLDSIFGGGRPANSEDSDVSSGRADSSPKGVNMDSDSQLAAAYMATAAGDAMPAAARAPMDANGPVGSPGFGFLGSAIFSPPPTNPCTQGVYGTQPRLQPILSSRQPTPPRPHPPFQDSDPMPDYRVPFTQQDFQAMPHANMPHQGPTPMQLACAVPSELPPTRNNFAIGQGPSNAALGQAQGFWPPQFGPPLTTPGNQTNQSEEFYVGSDGTSLASASHQTSEEQESEESSEDQESSVLNCWGPQKTGSSEGSEPVREVLVYVDRPVYVDRIVHVPVYVKKQDVKVKTIPGRFRPPTHDFPYHHPLPEMGCHFVCNDLLAY